MDDAVTALDAVVAELRDRCADALAGGALEARAELSECLTSRAETLAATYANLEPARVDATEATKQIEFVLDHAPAAHPARALWLLVAARAARLCLDLDTSDPTDTDDTRKGGDAGAKAEEVPISRLREAITRLTRPVQGFDREPVLASALAMLGEELLLRNDAHNAPDELNEGIDHLTASLRLSEKLSASRPVETLYLLGQALAARNRREHHGLDRDAAIDLLSEAVKHDTQGWRALLAVDSLADLLYDRWADGGTPADLDAAISHWAWLADELPEGSLDQSATLLAYGLALADRYDERCADLDRDKAIELLSSIADESGPAQTVHFWMTLGELALARYRQRRAGADADLAINAFTTALRVPSGEEPGESWIHPRLWVTLSERFEAEPNDQNLVSLITMAEDWRTSAPSDEHSAAVAMLGLALAEQVRRAARPDLLMDRAIAVLSEACALLDDGDELYVTALHELGGLVGGRGQLRSDPADLTEGTRLLTRALELTSPDDPQVVAVAGALSSVMATATHLGMLPAHSFDTVISMVEAVLPQARADPKRQATLYELLGMALTVRAFGSGGDADLDAGIRHLTEAGRLTTDPQERVQILVNLAGALQTRFFQRGELQDAETAVHYLDRIVAHLAADGAQSTASTIELGPAQGALAMARAILSLHRQDLAAMDSAITELETALGSVPRNRPAHAKVLSDLGTARFLRLSLRDHPAERRQATAELVAAGESFPPHHLEFSLLRLKIGAALTVTALVPYSAVGLAAAITWLREGLQSGARTENRIRFQGALGHALHQRFRHEGETAALEEALTWLELAREELGDRPGHSIAVPLRLVPARAYRDRATAGRPDEPALQSPLTQTDAERAGTLGLEALRAHAHNVLLQTGTDDALASARSAAQDALEVAGWRLADGAIAGAIEALEIGRGLVLFSATRVTGMPDRLDAMGERELAAQWRSRLGAGADSGPGPPGEFADGLPRAIPPDDLRARTVRALTAPGSEGAGLLAPPSIDELAQALQSAGRDALVYLIRGTPQAPGRAILVTDTGGTAVLPLPRLLPGPGDPLSAYVQAHQVLWRLRKAEASQVDEDRAFDQWETALEELCAWAGECVMRPLLTHVRQCGADHDPRLVLIPVGELGRIPWHAARLSSVGGRPHYVVHDAVISYAAGGRQFVDAVRRTPLPYDTDPVIVVDPTGGLPAAAGEAEAFRRCHTGATVLGRPGALDGGAERTAPGTPDEVLARLPGPLGPGASILHLACHGYVIPGSPSRSHLLLAHERELSVARILAQAQQLPPGSPGGLIMPIACVSALSDEAYDESLTVTTAFLAAGAATTIGALWELPDEPAAAMMFAFHRYLKDGDPAADAFRRAQLWMLDEARRPLHRMPVEMALSVSDGDLARVYAWAGFVQQGR